MCLFILQIYVYLLNTNLYSSAKVVIINNLSYIIGYNFTYKFIFKFIHNYGYIC